MGEGLGLTLKVLAALAVVLTQEAGQLKSPTGKVKLRISRLRNHSAHHVGKVRTCEDRQFQGQFGCILLGMPPWSGNLNTFRILVLFIRCQHSGAEISPLAGAIRFQRAIRYSIKSLLESLCLSRLLRDSNKLMMAVIPSDLQTPSTSN